MQAESFSGARKPDVLAPLFRHRAAESHHPLQYFSLALELLALVAAQFSSPVVQDLDETLPLPGQQARGVGGQKLVIAKRGRDRARPRLVENQPRLRIKFAITACLETVDPYRLLACDSGRGRDLRIGTLEVDFVGPLRHEAKMLLGAAQKIRDHRKLGLVLGLIFLLHRRITRTGRAGIDRRLFQHIVGQHHGLAVAALGIARLPLFADARPVRNHHGFMLGTRGRAFLQLLLVARDRLIR